MGKRGDGSRSALIATAERLFAENGVEAVSLRDVSAAAGQRNHSAAEYHFGDRAGLIAAVYEARMSVVNERRLGLLAELDESGPCVDLTALVEVFVVPLGGVVVETAGWYGRFVAQLRWDSFGAGVLAGLPSAVSAREVLRRVDRCLNQLPVSVRRSRVEQLITLVSGTMAGWEWARDRQRPPGLSAGLLAAELVTTGVSLLEAPIVVPRNSSQLVAIRD